MVSIFEAHLFRIMGYDLICGIAIYLDPGLTTITFTMFFDHNPIPRREEPDGRRTALGLLCSVVIIALAVSGRPALADKAHITVLAAASLSAALSGIAEAFERANPDIAVRLSFAASSTLARQIEAGAPADLYVSADPVWAQYLAERGRLHTGWRPDWLGNDLVLIATSDALPRAPVFELSADDSILSMLRSAQGANARLAIGDPDHVPVGRYGRAALMSLGQWSALAPHLAPTRDTLATIALVAQGVAPLGIAYLSDAGLSDAVRLVATFPADSHPPIRYALALVAKPGIPASPAARRFFEYLQGAAAQDILTEMGFITDLANDP